MRKLSPWRQPHCSCSRCADRRCIYCDVPLPPGHHPSGIHLCRRHVPGGDHVFDPEDVPCPSCGAGLDERCPTRHAHWQRVLAAWEARMAGARRPLPTLDLNLRKAIR